jgi:photosystem II stability/assembly factor-like uncharacterized protein
MHTLIHAQQLPWRLAIGSEGIPVNDIDIFQSNPATVYATGEYGLMLSTDRGEHWDTAGTLRVLGFGVEVDPFNSQFLYAIHAVPNGNSVDITTDGGLTWNTAHVQDEMEPVLELDPVDSGTVYAGLATRYIRRSTNYGQSWEQLTPPPDPADNLTSLAIARTNNRTLYAGYLNGILLKSTDRGSSWITLSLGIQFFSGVSLAVHPENANVVYAALRGFGFSTNRVFKTTDGGSTWFDRNNGLDSLPTINWHITCVAINPKYPEELFLCTGTQEGERLLFRSTNGGEQWESFSAGLPDSGSVWAVAIDTASNRVYAAVFSLNDNEMGIYILDSSSTSVDDFTDKSPDMILLNSNYPNPFNHSTTITYTISRRTNVRLEIYDLLGRKIETLVDEIKDRGVHKHIWNARNVSSGVYFFRFITEDFNQTRRILLIR